MALSVLHSRSHIRAFVLVFSKEYFFRKYDTGYFIFQLDKFYFSLYIFAYPLDLVIVFPMASSAVNSITDRNIDQLVVFVDQTTAEVASLQNKFDQ